MDSQGYLGDAVPGLVGVQPLRDDSTPKSAHPQLRVKEICQKFGGGKTVSPAVLLCSQSLDRNGMSTGKVSVPCETLCSHTKLLGWVSFE